MGRRVLLREIFRDAIKPSCAPICASPALARGVTTIWLAGISLGGFGALRYAEAHREIVEGLLLLSPFLGSRGLIAEVAAAGPKV